MKINTVEQFKAEIMYNTDFQEKLRENPAKAVEEVEVGYSHIREERMFSLVIGVVAGAVLLVGLIGIFILAASGPSASDIENLQAQIDGLKVSVAQASSDAQNAQSAAADASAKASAAESAANRAAQYAQDTNSKLDTLFKRSMEP